MDSLLQWVLVFSLSMGGRLLEVDPLGNLYVVGNNQQLSKLDSTGTLLFTYPQNRYGTLAQVDVSNPMKVLLSYPDFAQAVVLDNTLSELGLLALKRSGINAFSAMAYSRRDNTIWLFDRENWNLKKVDFHGTIVLNAPDLLQQTGQTLEPAVMREHENRIYVADARQGVWVFDAFGLFLEQLPVPPVTDFQIVDEYFIGISDAETFVYHLRNGQRKSISLPGNSTNACVRYRAGRWYVLSPDGLWVYQHTPR
ncbi:MAG: hypothetical protein RMK52_06620 [Chitinophagales bacterium]|nr:hypothetical protein [Chitinophagales bacterium]MDW8393901.1 hypothetical protein [Chitinophagales bacterium]